METLDAEQNRSTNICTANETERNTMLTPTPTMAKKTTTTTYLSLHLVKGELGKGHEPVRVSLGQRTRLLRQVGAALPGYHLRHSGTQHCRPSNRQIGQGHGQVQLQGQGAEERDRSGGPARHTPYLNAFLNGN